MDKFNKNIIEAGVTSAEFDDLFAGDVLLDDYLAEFPEQSWRYRHLCDLATMRGLDELSDYFWSKSGMRMAVDDCR